MVSTDIPYVILVNGISGAGKDTVIGKLSGSFADVGLDFHERWKVISFSGKLLEYLPVNDRDEIKNVIMSNEDIVAYHKKVFDDIFSMDAKRIIVNTHGVTWSPKTQQWITGFSPKLRKDYRIGGIALIEPEDIDAYVAQCENDASRNRNGFPDPGLFIEEERNRSKACAREMGCRYRMILNPHGCPEEAARELYSFIEASSMPFFITD